MTGRGRPYIGRTIEVRLPDDVRTELEAIADYSGWTLAALCRHAISQWAMRDDDSAYMEAFDIPVRP